MDKILKYLVWGVVLVRVSLAVISPLDVSVLQARLFYADANDPFIASRGLVKVMGKLAGTGTYQAAGVSVGLYLTLVYLLVRVVEAGQPKSPVWLLVLVAAFNPWLNYLTAFHWQESLGLVFFLAFWLDKNQPRRTLWAAFLTLSSASGLILGSGMLLATMSRKTFALNLAALALILAWFGTRSNLLTSYFESSPVRDLTPGSLGRQVDEVQKNIFLGSGKKIIYPAFVRKMVFNKAVLGIDRVLDNAISTLDFTKWTAPISAMSITRLSGIGPKGMFSQVYYWELPLLIYGAWIMVKEKGWRTGSIFLLAIVPALFWEKKWFYLAAYGLILVFCQSVMRAVERAPKAVWVIMGVVYCLGGYYFFKQLYFDTASYRTSDVYLYKQINLWVRKNQDRYQRIMVTNLFGPTEFMNSFYGGVDDAKLVYAEFDLKKNRPDPGTAYIGLPGQFDDSQEVFVIEAEDELVYRYGKGLWILE